MSSDKLDYNGLDTLSTVIKDFVLKKLNIEITNAKQYANQVSENSISISSPIGTIQAYAGNSLPNGWLLCDGSAISRTTYINLFTVIGTTYGTGNGSSTFNLPNLTDKVIQGNSSVGSYRNAGLPNITGQVAIEPNVAVNVTSEDLVTIGSTTGAFSGIKRNYPQVYVQNITAPTFNHVTDFDFNATRCSSIYGSSSTVQPPALTLRYIIKY